ncbi:GGDEF domain-containing protein [Pseudogracilibacillus sp. SE30717A]|uniref:GGDEF domain-containing protein n=1 Tax=Pseudogracilibacillus sp. SE30717A TaxID=3098293 RepID=UPI00300E3D0D
MRTHYRFKLFIVLFALANVITITITTLDYFRLKQQIIEDNQFKIEHATDTVKYALKTIDKAYYLLDEKTAKSMEIHTSALQEKYNLNPNFETWDFIELSKQMKMDIYIMDENNIIIYGSVPEEIGVDFSECCTSFNKILNKRRDEGKLFIDGIDLDQQSGEAKKFSYMATKDKKYIIELGYSLKNEEIFQQFNFLTIIDELVPNFELIEELHVLNFGGLPFGTTRGYKISTEQRKAFEKARENNEIVEIKTKHNGENVIIRYVPYYSEYDDGENTKIKVVEIMYNTHDLDDVLHENLKVFVVQLIIILVVTILVSSLIANWFAKPVYLAFHDSLTKLKNRAAFNDVIEQLLVDRKQTISLLMMDLDNFKIVNDTMGHGKGDYLLYLIGQTIKETIKVEGKAFRLGGDEFAIVMPNANKEESIQLAKKVIQAIEDRLNNENEINTFAVSVSIGIALSEETDNQESLYKKADIALYTAKDKGKNQFIVYHQGLMRDMLENEA